MAHIPKGNTVKVRTEREDQAGKVYVIAAGAPKHYIGGYGVCEAGDIVTLPAGTEPGKWLIHVNESDVQKVQADPSLAPSLAEAAAGRMKDQSEAQAAAEADAAAESKLADVGAAALAAAGGAAVTDATKDSAKDAVKQK